MMKLLMIRKIRCVHNSNRGYTNVYIDDGQSVFADPKFYETWVWPDDLFVIENGILPPSPYSGPSASGDDQDVDKEED